MLKNTADVVRRPEEACQPDQGLAIPQLSCNTLSSNPAAHRSSLTTPAKANATTLQYIIIYWQSYRHLYMLRYGL